MSGEIFFLQQIHFLIEFVERPLALKSNARPQIQKVNKNNKGYTKGHFLAA